MTRARRTAALSAGIWVLLFGVYLASPVQQFSDSKYALLSSEHLLHAGNLRLDEHFWPMVDSSGYPSVLPGRLIPRHIRRYGGHLYYFYPPGVSVLSAPLVAVLELTTGDSTLREDGTYDHETEARWQRWCAAFLTASACVLLFLMAAEILAPTPSVLIALAAGLGSQLWSTASRGLWTHTWIVVLLSAALWLIVRAETRECSVRPGLLGTLLAWSFFTRPTAGFFILALTGWTAVRRPREFGRLAVVGGAWALLFAVYCLSEYGRWLPPYYLKAKGVSLAGIPVGLAGQTISPARGLFVFVPLAGFAVWLVARHWHWIRYRSLAVAALAALLLHTLSMAGFENWWGGYCYGPRFHTDMVPIFVLLGVLGLDAAGRHRTRRSPLGLVATSIFAVCFAWGVLVNGAGALSKGGQAWNRLPRPIAEDPMRAFDWSHGQFLYALFPERFGAQDPPKTRAK